MLFNSLEYLFLFLPIVVVLYYTLCIYNVSIIAILWLVCASFFFYSYWKITYLQILITSICVNYLIGKLLELAEQHRRGQRWKKFFLFIGILFNVGLLGYYKYADFFIGNINKLIDTQIAEFKILLPLAISFFTFQQISYLVDTYQGKV